MTFFAAAASVPLYGQSLISFTDIYDANLPGSAFGWVDRNAHLAEPSEMVDLDLMGAIDWIIPNNVSAFGPGVFDRKETDTPRIEAFEPTGFSNSGAHHQHDNPIVPFLYTDGELTGASPDEGYWATSWIGDDPGGNATWIFRVEVGADSLEIWHWWNHGLANRQTVTATLFNAAGEVLLTDIVREHTTSIFSQYTTIINVTGTAVGDYLLIEHRGTNVGWRGSAVLSSGGIVPPEPDYGVFDAFPIVDGYALTGDWLGNVWVRDTFPFVKIETLSAWAFSHGEWLYFYGMEELTMVMLQGTENGFAYFFDIARFGYKHGNWVFFIR